MTSRRSLRVLHLIDSGGLYGAENVLLALASECQKMGHDPIVGTIVAPRDLGDALGEAAELRGLRHIPFLMRDGFRIAGLRKVLWYARQEGIDIVHTHGYRPNIMLAMVPRRYRPCPIVTTLHGWTATDHAEKLAIYEALERTLLPRLDGVVIVSEMMRQRLPRGIRASAKLVLNGIEIRQIKSAARSTETKNAASTSSNCRPLVLAVGRLSHEKGFDLLLDAVKLLRTEGLEIDLVLAGNGPEMNHLRERARKLSLLDYVDFRAFVPDMGPIYAEADVLVIPSRREGLPLVLLEAMAAEVPVVATRVGQIPRVLDDGNLGLLVSPGSARELSTAIRLTLENYDKSISRARLAKSAVQERYSAKTMAERYLKIYETLSP